MASGMNSGSASQHCVPTVRGRRLPLAVVCWGLCVGRWPSPESGAAVCSGRAARLARGSSTQGNPGGKVAQ